MQDDALPAGWYRVPLGQVATLQGGFAFPSELFGKGPVPVIRMSDLSNDKLDLTDAMRVSDDVFRNHTEVALKSGDLLVGMSGSLSNIAIVHSKDLPALLNQRVGRFILRSPGSLHYPILQHFIRSEFYSRQLRREAVGAAQLNVSSAQIEATVVPLPPLPEQRRIAEILDTLDEAIRKTEQVIAKLQQMKQGLLHDLLTRGIDENGELRDPERHPEQFKDSPLGRMPREWEIQSLVDVAEIRSGIAKNASKVVTNPVEVHYLRVANVQDGYLDLSEMSKIRISRDDVTRYAVRAGDVLMNEGGDLDKLGRGAIWRGQYEPCVHQNHVFVVRCGPTLIPEFLDAWTGSSPARRYFMVAGKQTTNLASINKTALGRLPVAIPSRLEQESIAAAFNVEERRLALESETVNKLRTLKQGLMDDLLTGRVRVSATDEAAA